MHLNFRVSVDSYAGIFYHSLFTNSMMVFKPLDLRYLNLIFSTILLITNFLLELLILGVCFCSSVIHFSKTRAYKVLLRKLYFCLKIKFYI
jgi:hypothetical protein